MKLLLRLSKAIDLINTWAGKVFWWCIFASVLISTVNALIRKIFSVSSNGSLEIQWYLFAWAFLGAAGYTLLNHEHVKIDVIYGRFSKKGQTLIDIIGLSFFLLPFSFVVLYMSIPLFYQAYISKEMSDQSGGLMRWPVYLSMLCGFGLLLAQGVSELIKRVAFLQGLIPDPTIKDESKSAEQLLAEEMAKNAERLELENQGSRS